MLQSGLRIRVGYPEFRHSARMRMYFARWEGGWAYSCAQFIEREERRTEATINRLSHSSISETNGSNPLKEERTKEGAEAP